MSRQTIFVFFLGLLFCTTGCCDKGENRVDIALEGPWILYQTHLDDGRGNKTPVLIAIAPMDATQEGLPDSHHHHSPQLSTGDGFYIWNSYLDTTRIFCVAFGPQCVSTGPDSLRNEHDGYPQSKLLKLNYSGKGTATWDWISSVYKNKGMALILPMPDSFSDDGVWHMRFRADGNQKWGQDEERSIGVHLHYAHGPGDFTLRACKTAPPSPPALVDCNTDVGDQKHPKPTTLTNSGTLRIQMRAPDNDDPCDPHALYAWGKVFNVLGDSFGAGYNEIDPAESVNSNGAITWVSEDAANCKPMPTDREAMPAEKTSSLTIKADTFESLGTAIGQIVKYCTDDPENCHASDSNHQQELESMKALQQELATLDPFFPRISQLMRVGALSHSSFALVTSLQTQAKVTARLKARNNEATLPDFDLVLRGLGDLDNNPDTKNGADCRAAVVSAQ